MIFFISEGAPDYPDNIVLSSNGPSSEKYPDSLGEYQLLPEKSHNGRPVYQSLARDDRYIIYIGNNIIYNYHNINISHQDLPFITGTSHVIFLTLL